MALNDAALAVQNNALAGVVTHIGLHTSDASGAELSGGSPAYARKAVTWNTATDGNLDMDGTLLFDVPSGVTITHAGLWSASTGGTYYGTLPLSASEEYAAQGQYELTDADVDLV